MGNLPCAKGIPVEDAKQVLRDKVAEASREESVVFLGALEGFKRFAQTQFEVPDTPDSDGCLIEYGISEASRGPEFCVHLVRQFEQLYKDGDHEKYIQTSCDMTFPLDEQLKTLGGRVQWWFRSSGDNFNSWWTEQTSSSWMQLLSQRAPKSIEFVHEVV